MRLHTDVLTRADLLAALPARDVYCESTPHGSRKRARAFEVSLTGYGKRHTRAKNSGAHGGYGDGERAATWSDWGRWLAALYAIDPNMNATYYTSSGDFDAKTHGLFAPGAAVTPRTLADDVRATMVSSAVGRSRAAGFVADEYGLPSYVVTSAIFGEVAA